MNIKTPDYLTTDVKFSRWLTPGRRYPISDDFGDGALYSILDDEGDPIIVRAPGCAHLDGATWRKGYIHRV